MALLTEVERDGKNLTVNWRWWHVDVMIQATEDDSNGMVKLTEVGEYVLTEDITATHPADGEVWELKAGDILRMWRDR